MNVQEIWRKADEKQKEYRSIGETELLQQMFDKYQG